MIDQSASSDASSLPNAASSDDVELMWYYKNRQFGVQKIYFDGIASIIDIRGALWVATLEFA